MPQDLFDLSNKVALVTGGCGLLGRRLCEGLADYGATVVIVDIDAEAGNKLVDHLGGDARFIKTDITDCNEVQKLVQTVVAEFGRVDILVNSAYPRNENYGARYEDVSIDDWRENVDLHLNSYFLTSKWVSKAMMDQNLGGSIINFGSTYGVQAPDFNIYEGTNMTSPVEYSAIKGGILNLVRYMASYLGEYNIRVNAISPGGVFDGQDEKFVEQYNQNTPLNRMAKPLDVVGPVIFLASEASAYITGHNLIVDGGWTIQ